MDTTPESITYTNPVADIYCADPFVLLHEGIYYAYGTHYATDASGSWLPRAFDGKQFALLTSLDLVHWEERGGALVTPNGFAGRSYWAPEVAYDNGKFWMYYSTEDDSGMHRLRVAVANQPSGPFQDQGMWLFPDFGFTIDAHPFRDPQDGQWYLFFSLDKLEGKAGTGICVVKLAADMVTVIGEPVAVLFAWADWHVSIYNHRHYGQDWARWHTVEGAHVIYRDDRYYMLYSGGAWTSPDYGVSFAVADHPLGPWLDDASADGPAVLSGVPGRIVGPGHNSVVMAPDGETLMCAYHAWDEAQTGRRLCVDRIDWTEKGPHVTPTYGTGLVAHQ